ncbi:MAG TPA: OmpA family protein [Rhodocyclaceae bacterium]|nr:OmpA family protein [Rhodocyclaceae bacterium]
MTPSFLSRVGALGLVGCCAVLASSCSLLGFPTPTDPTAGTHAEPPARIAQLDFGPQAVFTLCVPPACPTRTLKTLSTETPRQPINTAAALVPDKSISSDPVTTKPDTMTVTTRAVTVQFAFGSARLSPAARAQLDDATADVTAAHRVRITGRTDSKGPLAVNEKLALARAHAVRDHLLKAHPALRSALTVQAQGACCFIAPNDTRANRALNRRVEVVFQIENPP